MAWWLYRGLRRGVVTTRYPKTVDAWTQALPSAPAFRSARLTRELADKLEACCPAGALARDRDDLIVDLGACTGCGQCLEVGVGVVAPSGEFLLATGVRAGLVKRVPIRGSQGSR